MIHPNHIHQRPLTIEDKIQMIISSWNEEDKLMKKIVLGIAYFLIGFGIYFSFTLQFIHPFLIFAIAALYFFYRKFPVGKENISEQNALEATKASYQDARNFFLKVLIIQALYIFLYLLVQYSGYFEFLALTQQDNTLLNEISNVGSWLLFPFVLYNRYGKRVRDLEKLGEELG